MPRKYFRSVALVVIAECFQSFTGQAQEPTALACGFDNRGPQAPRTGSIGPRRAARHRVRHAWPGRYPVRYRRGLRGCGLRGCAAASGEAGHGGKIHTHLVPRVIEEQRPGPRPGIPFGAEVFEAARRHGRAIAFEASVAGGIPIIAALAQSLSANQIVSLQGILNGT